MIWKLAKKDLLLYLMTFKFAVGTIVCVLLTVALMPALVHDYQQRWQEYRAGVTADEEELRAAKVYDNVTSGRRVYRPPPVLSVFSRGVESQVSNSASISDHSMPEIGAGWAAVNPYLAILRTLDLSLLYQMVLSLLALLVACDAISGERVTGTLMLIASGTVARHEVLLAKVVAGVLTLVVPLTMAFLSAILVLSLSSVADLAAADWVRMGLLYVVTLLFLLAVYNGGLLISCLTGCPVTSLMLGLFFWVILALIIPNAGGYLAAQFRPLEPDEPIKAKISALDEEYFFKAAGASDKIPLRGHGVEHREKAFRRYTLVCDEAWIDSLIKRNLAREPFWREYVEKSWELEHQYVETLLRQERLATSLSRISPVCMYENVMSALAGTDTAGCRSFVAAARAHRQEVLDYVRAKTNNLQAPLLFTPCTPADRQQYQQYLDKKMSEEEFQRWKDRKIAHLQPLDLQDYPRFVYRGDILRDLRASLLDVSALVFANALFFVLAFTAFLKYDVR